MKKILRNTLSSFSYGVAKITGQANAGNRILCYHKVNPVDQEYLNVPVDQFREQMQFLKKSGYQTVSVNDLLSCEFDSKQAVITFDDGYLDNYENAVPILKDCGFTATFYCIAEMVGKKGYMSAEQLKEMISDGFEVGSHTLSHPELPTVSVEEKKRQIAESKKRLSDLLSTNIRSFCYPRGLYDEDSLHFVSEAGYETAVSNRPGANFYKRGRIKDERFILRRTEIAPNDSIQDFSKKMAGAFDPLHRALHALRGRP